MTWDVSLQNVKRHKAEVDSQAAVPGVNDRQAMELREWRNQCSSITGFGLYQRAGSNRSGGGKRKASKPQLEHLKQRISISTQIQVRTSAPPRHCYPPPCCRATTVHAL